MSQQTDSVLNIVLIDMARSFLQYVAEGWPWVSTGAQAVEDQVLVIAARQRQDVGDIANLLTGREHFIDFGSFPTEYTDLQFLALEALFERLHNSQARVLAGIAKAVEQVRGAADEQALELLTAIDTRERELAAALKDLQEELAKASSST